MTSQQFIEKALSGTTRRTSFQSIVALGGNAPDDAARTVYSYGSHYPLVKIIDGKAFINDAGYSTTTGKHISWAFRAAAAIVGWDNCYHAPLVRGSQLEPEQIIDNATANAQLIQAEMDAKKRKDTSVYAWLQCKLDRMNRTIAAAQSLVPEGAIAW